jgi:hypothetical protein
MPLYEYECTNGHTTERYFYKALGLHKVPCTTCGSLAKRIMSTFMCDTVNNPYYDEHLGAYITSHRQRSRLMNEKGLLEKSKSDMSVSEG